jgi:hypothetical protein
MLVERQEPSWRERGKYREREIKRKQKERQIPESERWPETSILPPPYVSPARPAGQQASETTAAGFGL